MEASPLDLRSRMGDKSLLNLRSRRTLLPQHNYVSRKKKRIRSKVSDLGAFGPWITDREKSFNETFVNTVGKPPQIKIDLSG